MTIVNACLGGLANAVPSGQAVLNLTWITNDGENQQVTFSISGASAKSVQSDANGFASVQLPVGAYTVAVVHDGEYIGDDPKSVTLTSRGTFALTWLTGARNAQVVTFNSPYALTSSSASYSITLGGTTVESGSSWSTSMTFNLYGGNYVLTLGVYGTSVTYEFTVPKNSGFVKDLSELFSRLTVSASGGYQVKNVTLNGYTVPDTSVYASSQTVTGLRGTNLVVGATVDFTGEIPQFSGAISGPIYSVSFLKSSRTLSDATQSVELSMQKTGIKYIISYDSLGSKYTGTLTVPSAAYSILCVGGGGGGGASVYDNWHSTKGGGGGGGSGYIGFKSASLNGNYAVTLGIGGKGGEGGSKDGITGGNGGITSFGSIISASGGEYGKNAFKLGGAGGNGGSGGGGGGTTSNYVKDQSGNGGTGDARYGGGGGGGGSIYSTGVAGKGGSGATGGTGSDGTVYDSITDLQRLDGGAGGTGKVQISSYSDLYTYLPNGGAGGGLFKGKKYSSSGNTYPVQPTGGAGGDSPLGKGGVIRIDTTNSRNMYYVASSPTGWGAGGCGGCRISSWWKGDNVTNAGTYGSSGAIAIKYLHSG